MTTQDYHITDPKSPRRLERLVMQKAVLKLLVGVSKEEQTELADSLGKGESLSVTNERGVKIGTVSKSFPKSGAKIKSLDLAMADFEADDIEMYIDQRDYDEIVDVVAECAPELLKWRPTEVAHKKRAAEVVKKWEATGEVAPGWEITEKDGICTVRPNAVATEVAENMVGSLAGVLAIEDGAKGELNG